MEAVSCHHLLEGDTDLDQRQASATLDSPPFWVHGLHSFDNPGFSPSDSRLALTNADFLIPYESQYLVQFRGSNAGSLTPDDPFDRGNHANFVMDPFQQRVEESRVVVEGDLSTKTVRDSGSGGFEGTGETGSNNFELDLGLGLRRVAISELEDENSGFMVADSGDEFFVQRRVSNSGPKSAVPDPEVFATGVRVSGFRSVSTENENGFLGIELQTEGDTDRWGCLQLEDHSNEDFEWEELDGITEEREVLSMVIDADDNGSVSVSPVIASEEELRVERVGGGGLANLEWQVLSTPDILERNSDVEHAREPHLGDPYEMLFEQFAENESALMGGRPPASRTAVLNLLSVSVTPEDLQKDNAGCAICKDGFIIGEQAKLLPCSHRYHGDCIAPWLGIRNTCPVCRFELPTDDPAYEQQRIQRAGQCA